MKRGGYVFCQKWWVKGKGVGPRGVASMYKALSSTPRFFPLEKNLDIIIKVDLNCIRKYLSCLCCEVRMHHGIMYT